MNNGRTVFSQLIEYLPNKEFQGCVSRFTVASNDYTRNHEWTPGGTAVPSVPAVPDREVELCEGSVGLKSFSAFAQSKTFIPDAAAINCLQASLQGIRMP